MSTATATAPTTTPVQALPQVSPAAIALMDELKAQGAYLMRSRREILKLKADFPDCKFERKVFTGDEAAFDKLIELANYRAANPALTKEAHVGTFMTRLTRCLNLTAGLIYTCPDPRDEQFRKECTRYLAQTTVTQQGESVKMSPSYLLGRLGDAMEAYADYKSGIEGILVGFAYAVNQCAKALGVQKNGKPVVSVSHEQFMAWQAGNKTVPASAVVPVESTEDDWNE